MNEILKKGQVLIIQGKRYVTTGLIKYKEDNYTWQEYRLVDEMNQIKWLNVEEDEGEIIYSIYYENNTLHGNINDETIQYNSECYNIFEYGEEQVIRILGKCRCRSI